MIDPNQQDLAAQQAQQTKQLIKAGQYEHFGLFSTVYLCKHMYQNGMLTKEGFYNIILGWLKQYNRDNTENIKVQQQTFIAYCQENGIEDGVIKQGLLSMAQNRQDCMEEFMKELFEGVLGIKANPKQLFSSQSETKTEPPQQAPQTAAGQPLILIPLEQGDPKPTAPNSIENTLANQKIDIPDESESLEDFEKKLKDLLG